MADTWDPDRYLTYADERGRPFADLMARVSAEPATVVDLGCGPGNLTALLADRWPAARVVGVDSSSAMIAKATDERITWRVADLRDWVSAAPAGSVDVLVSNATFHWVSGHLDLLPALARAVSPGGWFAFQVPGNFAAPSHTLGAQLAAEPPYAAHTADVEAGAAHDPAAYLRALAAEGLIADAWETTYLHVLTGPDPVFTWISGTSLRPTLAALPADLRPAFERELKGRLAEAFPVDDAGRVLLPFRRVFAVGHKR
ncbi:MULTISPECIES: methyltransferase domain-containing protein [Pseudofrankia]|uniref:methyltransferase domain-containing protein n=1 Tax=Pseudofrankia TaxID=2994363 RepID=UPI000234CDE1|nr:MULTISPECIES: methyltransferase domain-containing protein [Pseudofrankia]OHV35310.1 trans-aconitate methyltransferase [Pseudofrankia sp. EUN1h]